MILHLVVPGLFAPLMEWQRSYGWTPNAPGLRSLLSGAAKLEGVDCDGPRLCAELLGLDGGGALPMAGLRRIAQGFGDDGQTWVCADPVHLRADVDSAILVESELLALGEDEAQALIAELHAVFGPDGWCFESSTPRQWYARPPVDFELPVLPTVREVAGNDVGIHLRNIPQAIEYKKFYSELQMVLTHSTVNASREQRGEAAINALWFWGAGRVSRPLRTGELCAVQAEDDVLAGIGSVAGVAVGPPSLEHTLAMKGDVFVNLDDLRREAAYDDLAAWEEALAVLDRVWFAPLAGCLERREMDEVVVYADDRRWHARRRRGLARWRREPELIHSLGLGASE